MLLSYALCWCFIVFLCSHLLICFYGLRFVTHNYVLLREMDAVLSSVHVITVCFVVCDVSCMHFPLLLWLYNIPSLEEMDVAWALIHMLVI